MSQELKIVYYTVKRSFLFLDEWLLYYVLYKLYKSKMYKMTVVVLMYGMSCMYTSYKNIDNIEAEISNVNQIIWITNKTPIEMFRQMIKYFQINNNNKNKKEIE